MFVHMFNGKCQDSVKQAFIDAYSPKPANVNTVFHLNNGTTEEYDIVGILDNQWMTDHGYWISAGKESGWGKSASSVEIGTHVTAITAGPFSSALS